MVAIMEFIRLDAHMLVPVRGRYTYYQSTAEATAEPTGVSGGRFFQLLAEIEITGDARGVICSQYSPCGGYSLFLRDGKLGFIYDAPDKSPVARLLSDAPSLGKHVVGVEFTRKEGAGRAAMNAVTLSVDGRSTATAPLRALPARFAPCGEGLWIGCVGGDGLREKNVSPFPLTGARVIEVVFDVAEEAGPRSEPARSPTQSPH